MLQIPARPLLGNINPLKTLKLHCVVVVVVFPVYVIFSKAHFRSFFVCIYVNVELLVCLCLHLFSRKHILCIKQKL